MRRVGFVLSDEDIELRARLLSQADLHGHTTVVVPPDNEGAGYAFSVGAWRRFGVAEAVVIGLDQGMGEMLINAYVKRAAQGERFQPGRLYHDFFEGVPIMFERVYKGYYPEFFGSAYLLYDGAEFAAVQIIVPTPQGKWPWEPDAPEGFHEHQLILTESGLPESWTPGVTGP